MRKYRVYHVQPRGSVTPGGAFECENDEGALAQLATFAQPEVAAELWEGERYVGQAPARVAQERR